MWLWRKYFLWLDVDLTWSALWLNLTQKIGLTWTKPSLVILRHCHLQYAVALARMRLLSVLRCCVWSKISHTGIIYMVLQTYIANTGNYNHLQVCWKLNSCPLLNKGKTTQNQNLKKFQIHQCGQTKCSSWRDFQTGLARIWPPFQANSVPLWCRPTACFVSSSLLKQSIISVWIITHHHIQFAINSSHRSNRIVFFYFKTWIKLARKFIHLSLLLLFYSQLKKDYWMPQQYLLLVNHLDLTWLKSFHDLTRSDFDVFVTWV